MASYLTALYIKNTYPNCRKIYVIGGHGLNQEINDLGLKTLWGKEHDDLKMNQSLFHNFETEDDIDVVVIDLFFSFKKVCNFDRQLALIQLLTYINIAMLQCAYKKELNLLQRMKMQI